MYMARMEVVLVVAPDVSMAMVRMQVARVVALNESRVVELKVAH